MRRRISPVDKPRLNLSRGMPPSGSGIRAASLSQRNRRYRLLGLLLIGLTLLALTGCGVLVRGVSNGLTSTHNSPLFRQGRHGPLDEHEQKAAETAWHYFENNHNPKTGLVNSVDRYPATTMWHTGDYLAAMVSARELDIITPCEFDERLSSVVHFLNTMPLFFDRLPNKVYNTQSGAMVDYSNQPGEIGWSAMDIGRLLTWLYIVKCRYPIFSEYIDKAVLRWNFCDILDNCGTLYGGLKVHNKIDTFQEGRLGYEEYSARGYQLWGFSTTQASKIEPYEMATLYGVRFPYDSRDVRETNTYAPVLSMGYLLDGLEFNWDKTDQRNGWDSYHSEPDMARIADAIYEVQEARYMNDHIFTARTDHQVEGPPYFVYDSIFAAGYPWNVISDNGQHHEDQALVSTRTAFGMWGLWKTPYTDRLMKLVHCLNDPEKGWYEGRLENTGEHMKLITSGTNAAVLETLLYKSQGKLSSCPDPQDERPIPFYDLQITDPFKEEGKCLPLERKGCVP
ncbi:DUF3131 domain-containing protein [Desulfoluna sp.]|uniref:DUF3131 domain-containing protein n=1 Tax=Desulfoluna sp. TaxID=2045199 RepID=UPI00260FB70E|nr:DUF3131 domain-containing protein [Desulfoluna sp.]